MEARQVHPVALPEGAPRGSAPGLYVHVPFCARRCHYCSFATAPLGDRATLEAFLGALDRELDLLGQAPWARRVSLATVFLGGGTPSLLAPDEVAALLDGVRRRFALADAVEVTVECNPESVDRDRLVGYRRAGVTRLSLGVQSLDDRVLAALGRLHSAAEASAALGAAREAGFDNLSVDLMYGLPGLDLATWQRTLDGVLDREPEHLSAYGLALDADSRWGAAGGVALPPEETVVEQYWALARAAAARGLEHYEISNYARPGFRSRHNLGYWRRGEYLAAGPGACGFLGDVRWANARALPRYLDLAGRGAPAVDSMERLAPRQALAERLILGLRLSEGVPAAWLDTRAAGDPVLARRLDAWRAAGLLRTEAGRARLTEAGFLLSDALFVDLL